MAVDGMTLEMQGMGDQPYELIIVCDQEPEKEAVHAFKKGFVTAVNRAMNDSSRITQKPEAVVGSGLLEFYASNRNVFEKHGLTQYGIKLGDPSVLQNRYVALLGKAKIEVREQATAAIAAE